MNCLRRNNASKYFGVCPPSLEDYVESVVQRKQQLEVVEVAEDA